METSFYQHSASLPQTHMHRSTACAVTLRLLCWQHIHSWSVQCNIFFFFFKDEGKKERKKERKKASCQWQTCSPSKQNYHLQLRKRPRLRCHRWPKLYRPSKRVHHLHKNKTSFAATKQLPGDIETLNSKTYTSLQVIYIYLNSRSWQD